MSNAKLNQQIITKNWPYKVMAVLASLLIWASVTITLNPLTEVRHAVSVELRGLDNLTMDNTDYKVNVRVQGSAATINTLRAADIEAYADFTGQPAGVVMVPVVVDAPSDVVVLGQTPQTITVELKENRTELFPMDVDIAGEPAANYKVMPAVLSPAEVRLRGTDEYIRKVSRVYVAASIQDIEEGFEKDLSVIVEDVVGNDISTMFSIDPRVVKVVIPVVYNKPEKTVSVRVPIVGEPALGYQLSLVSVTPSTVRVFGDINRLQSLLYVETETLDVTDMRFDDSFTLNLALGNGFTADKSQVTVALQIEPVNYVTFNKTLVLTNNLGENLAAEVEKQDLNIMVYGPETFIATLDEADIVPYVDCVGLTEGEYSLPIRVSLPDNIQLMNVSVDEAAVNIYSTETEDEASSEEEQPPDSENVLPPTGNEEVI